MMKLFQRSKKFDWEFYEGESADPDKLLLTCTMPQGLSDVDNLLQAFVLASGNAKKFYATNHKEFRSAWHEGVSDG